MGIGGSITWDTRDRPLFPRRGTFLQAWFLQYPQAIGRHREFARANVEGRWFLPLGKERVLGTAAFVEQAFGDVPFTMLPRLGSTRFLRGWREGRFRDKLAWAAQAELRVPLWGRDQRHRVRRARRRRAATRARCAPTPSRSPAASGCATGSRRRGRTSGSTWPQSRAGPEIYVLVLDAF